MNHTEYKHAGRRCPAEDKIAARQNRGTDTIPLMQFVTQQFPDAPRADIKKWLKFRHLMINGIVTTAFDADVCPGDWVEINFSRPFIVFSHHRMQIVYEDDDIIVVNKGYGLLSVATHTAKTPAKTEETAYSILREYVKRKNPANKIFVIHRLDRGTSGLMMFAKNIEAQEAMQHNWNNMVLERKYVAVLEGILDSDSGTIRSNLAETSQFEVYSTSQQGVGRLAVTRYNVLRRGKGRTLAEFSLDTGRKNQIRVHAAKELAHPIVGDKKYGAKTSPIHRLALHARTLRFVHPLTKKDMMFETPVPQKFNDLV